MVPGLAQLALGRAQQGLLTNFDEARQLGQLVAPGQPVPVPLRPATLEAAALPLGSWGSFELNRLSSGSARRAEVSGKEEKKIVRRPLIRSG